MKDKDRPVLGWLRDQNDLKIKIFPEKLKTEHGRGYFEKTFLETTFLGEWNL